MEIQLRIIKSTTAFEHRETKKFRSLDKAFESAAHALYFLICYIAGLACDWDRIDFRLIRRKEERGGEAKEKAG